MYSGDKEMCGKRELRRKCHFVLLYDYFLLQPGLTFALCPSPHCSLSTKISMGLMPTYQRAADVGQRRAEQCTGLCTLPPALAEAWY